MAEQLNNLDKLQYVVAVDFDTSKAMYMVSSILNKAESIEQDL